MADDPLAGFPVRIEVPVAWGEMDAFGHVNNVVYLRGAKLRSRLTRLESGD